MKTSFSRKYERINKSCRRVVTWDLPDFYNDQEFFELFEFSLDTLIARKILYCWVLWSVFFSLLISLKQCQAPSRFFSNWLRFSIINNLLLRNPKDCIKKLFHLTIFRVKRYFWAAVKIDTKNGSFGSRGLILGAFLLVAHFFNHTQQLLHKIKEIKLISVFNYYK